MEVALDFYLISIRKKRKRGLKKLQFDNFDGHGASGVAALSTSLGPLVKGNWKDIPEKTLTVIGLKTNAVGITGTLKVGTYGRAGGVIDVNSGARAFEKKKWHAEEVPHYFRVYVPAGGYQGYFVTERLGINGVSGLIRQVFRDYFEKAYPDYGLDIVPMSPDFVVKRFIKSGEPRSVSFIKHSIPSDYADIVAGKHKEHPGSVQVTIKSSDAKFFRKSAVSSAITKVDGIKSVYEFQDFEPDDVKMTVDMGGKFRTVSLQNQKNMRSSFDITDDVSLNVSGYPNQKDVSEQAVELMKEMSHATGIKI